MKLIFKSILLIVLFLVALLVFSPKEGLYNLVEKELYKKGIIVSGEIVKEKFFGVNVNSGEVYYEGVDAALVSNLDFSTYMFYSNIIVDDLRVSKSLSNLVPSKIENINITHSIVDFNKIKINVNGDFGAFNGELLLLDKKIVGELLPSNIMKSKYRNILREFKLKEGKYTYEYRF